MNMNQEADRIAEWLRILAQRAGATTDAGMLKEAARHVERHKLPDGLSQQLDNFTKYNDTNEYDLLQDVVAWLKVAGIYQPEEKQ